MFISCFSSSDVPRALPTSSVRPFDSRKELEWLPACLYFLNLVREYHEKLSKEVNHCLCIPVIDYTFLNLSVKSNFLKKRHKSGMSEAAPCADQAPWDGLPYTQHPKVQQRQHYILTLLVPLSSFSSITHLSDQP